MTIHTLGIFFPFFLYFFFSFLFLTIRTNIYFFKFFFWLGWDADGSSAFVVLACDGVWDVLSNAEAAALVAADAPTLRDRAGAVVKAAFDKGSTDNISVVVIRIEP